MSSRTDYDFLLERVILPTIHLEDSIIENKVVTKVALLLEQWPFSKEYKDDASNRLQKESRSLEVFVQVGFSDNFILTVDIRIGTSKIGPWKCIKSLLAITIKDISRLVRDMHVQDNYPYFGVLEKFYGDKLLALGALYSDIHFEKHTGHMLGVISGDGFRAAFEQRQLEMLRFEGVAISKLNQIERETMAGTLSKLRAERRKWHSGKERSIVSQGTNQSGDLVQQVAVLKAQHEADVLIHLNDTKTIASQAATMQTQSETIAKLTRQAMTSDQGDFLNAGVTSAGSSARAITNRRRLLDEFSQIPASMFKEHYLRRTNSFPSSW